MFYYSMFKEVSLMVIVIFIMSLINTSCNERVTWCLPEDFEKKQLLFSVALNNFEPIYQQPK